MEINLSYVRSLRDVLEKPTKEKRRKHISSEKLRRTFRAVIYFGTLGKFGKDPRLYNFVEDLVLSETARVQHMKVRERANMEVPSHLGLDKDNWRYGII